MTQPTSTYSDPSPFRALRFPRLLDAPQDEPDVTGRRLRGLSRTLLVLACLVPLLGLLPEIVWLTPDLNDGAFHLGLIRNTVSALEEGASWLDFWVPTWIGGYPLFQFYQPGPYLLVALLHKTLAGVLPLLLLYRLLTVLALTLFPLAMYRALVALGLDRGTAAWGGLLSVTVAAHGSYGIEFESFTWAGWGLFAQACALPLLPLALAGGFNAVERGRRTFGYALLLAACSMTHILYGYIVVLSLALLPFLALRRVPVWRRVLGLLRFYAQGGFLVAFFVVPLVLHLHLHGKSLYDPAVKFDSHGAAAILSRLIAGDLFDHGRLPVLTCLVLAGLYLGARRWCEGGSRVHGWLVSGTLFWLCAYFGRHTWGPLMDLVPLSHGLHQERLVNAVQFFAIGLAAVAMGELSRLTLSWSAPRWRLAGIGMLVVLTAPLLGERIVYLHHNATLTAAAQRDFQAAWETFRPIDAYLAAHRHERVYAGHSADWGHNYRVGQVPVYHLLSAQAQTQIGNSPFSWPLVTDLQFHCNISQAHCNRLFDVRFVLTDQTIVPPDARLVLSSGPHRLYAIAGGHPFDLVSVPMHLYGDKESVIYPGILWMKSAWPEGRTHVRWSTAGEMRSNTPGIFMLDRLHYRLSTEAEMLEHSIFEPPGLFSAPAPAPVRGVRGPAEMQAQMVRASVSLEAPGVLLFKSTYHPAWTLRVDGQPVQTFMLSPGFVGADIPAGEHDVYAVYEPGVTKWLLLVIGLALAAALDRWQLTPLRDPASVEPSP